MSFSYFGENVENKDHFWIKAEMSEPEETKEPQPGIDWLTLKKKTNILIKAVPVRGSMESEGDLTDISPMVTPRPSGATEQNQLAKGG